MMTLIEWVVLAIAWGLGFWAGWKTGRQRLQRKLKLNRTYGKMIRKFTPDEKMLDIS